MKLLARLLSGIIHPLLMPLVGILILFTYTLLATTTTVEEKLVIYATVFAFTAFFPALFLLFLYKMGQVTSIGLNHRQERKRPFIICMGSFIACTLFLNGIGLPAWVVAFMAGGFISLAIDNFVNKWWKISVHQTGIGGIIAVAAILPHLNLIAFPSWLLPLTLIAGGALGASRVYLGRHTLMQVIAGSLNGFCSVYLSMLVCI